MVPIDPSDDPMLAACFSSEAVAAPMPPEDRGTHYLSLDFFKKQVEAATPYAEKQRIVAYQKLLDIYLPLREEFELLQKSEATKPASKKNPVKVRKLQKDLEKLESDLRAARDKSIQDAHRLYSHAYQAPLPMVLGPEGLRGIEGKQEMLNFGVLSGDGAACPAEIKRAGVDITTGSILCDKNWSVFKNDAYILGVILSRKTVYVTALGSPAPSSGLSPIPDAVLWDSVRGGPTVVGRELSQLFEAGYRQVANPAQLQLGGAVFVPPKDSIPIDFQRLVITPDHVKDVKTLQAMLAPTKDDDVDMEGDSK